MGPTSTGAPPLPHVSVSSQLLASSSDEQLERSHTEDKAALKNAIRNPRTKACIGGDAITIPTKRHVRVRLCEPGATVLGAHTAP